LFNSFPSLAEAFLNYFDLDLVETQQQRYRVYCEEFGYEPTSTFPDHRETDSFDDHSIHCIITHRSSGETAGCVRLICATEEHQLPLETYCLENVFVDYLDSLAYERNHVCEVSRLAVDPAFRRRPGERHTRLGKFDAMDCCHQEQRTFSLISLAAVLAGFAMSSLTDRTRIYTMMESNLPRLLRRAGILMQLAGNPMEYHGLRSAYFITTDFALSNMRDDLHVMYDAIYGRLAFNNSSREHVA
jgi:N-acyl amino acid synthase of PEP-CTERM/exosortase system